MEATLTTMMESDQARGTAVTRPRVRATASAPAAAGTSAATSEPKAAVRRTTVRGRARRSAVCASAVLVRHRSKLIAASPVHRSEIPG